VSARRRRRAQLLAAVGRDGEAELLSVEENAVIGLALTAVDAMLRPDFYSESATETVHNLLALHARHVEALRLRFGLEPEKRGGTWA